MQLSYIEIDRLRIFARHGVLEQERNVGNIFEVSLRLYYDFRISARTDDIGRALNYALVVDTVNEIMKTPRNLLETVVSEIQHAITMRWPEVYGGRICLSKLHPPFSTPVGCVSAIVEWDNSQN